MIRWRTFTKLTRIEQSFFGLPFLLTSLLLALESTPVQWTIMIWIIPCFILARTAGMAFNQLIDSELDGKNPRTQNRVIPSKHMTAKQAQIIAWGSLFLFICFALRINFTLAMLTPFAALLLFLYSYTKRLHFFCHLVLGSIHFLGSAMAFAALTDSLTPAAICLSGASACLIIGSDIIYAMQDYEFDRKEGLHSIPAYFGIKKSFYISWGFHLLCVFFLFGVGLLTTSSWIYYFLLPLVLGHFILFHFPIWKIFLSQKWETIQGIEKGCFTCNVSVALSVLLFTWLGLQV